MRSYLVVLLALATSTMLASSAAAQGEMQPLASGRGTSEVTLLLVDSAARASAEPSTIRVDYGQPHLRGRELHTDSLVPYGQVWRTGANEATTLTTDVDLTIGGEEVPSGTYILQTLPARDGWTLLIHGNAEQPPIARVPLRHTTLPAPLESLTMWLIPSLAPGAPSGELRLAWGTSQLSTDWTVR